MPERGYRNFVDGAEGVAPAVHGAEAHNALTRVVLIREQDTIAASATPTTLGAGLTSSRVLQCADGATQGALFTFAVPNDATAGQPLTLSVLWAPGSTDAAAHSVRWEVGAKVAGVGADVTAAGTTTTFSGDSAARTATLLVAETAVQVLASVNPGDVIRCRFNRLGGAAEDTYVGAVNVLGLKFFYASTR